MGTRGLTVVIAGGKNVIAQYGQWDHYPDGQGLDTLAFLCGKNAVDRLRENIPRITEETPTYHEAVRELCVETGVEWQEIAPQLSRDMGAGILNFVANADKGPIYLRDDSEFEHDTLMCEGVFEVDLDKNTYRFYSPGHFTGPTYSLDNLPDDATFVKENTSQDEDD